MRFYYSIFTFFSILSLFSCGLSSNQEKGENIENDYSYLISDTCYLSGFNVGDVVDGKPGIVAVLDYNGNSIGNPVWMIGQWNNYNNNLKDATYSQDGDSHSYVAEHGTAVIVDTKEGAITLQINTSSEYGKNPVSPNNPRKEGDKWPHLLLGRDFQKKELLKLSDKEEIRMDIEYVITQMENDTPMELFNNNIHAAQFQWYITANNFNDNSPGRNEYLWFGLCYYDSRYDYPPFYAAKDTNTTDALIYKPDMKEIMKEQGKMELGKQVRYSVDILPLLKEAFDLAIENGFMKDTQWDDLYIGSMNIGWEIFGTYNASVTINSCQIRYK